MRRGQTSLRVDQPLLDRLDYLAGILRVSRSELVRAVLWDGVRRLAAGEPLPMTGGTAEVVRLDGNDLQLKRVQAIRSEPFDAGS